MTQPCLTVSASTLTSACGGGTSVAPSESRGAAGGAPASDQGGQLKLAVLSSRAELVSGGDALLRVQVPAGIDLSRVSVLSNGTDVTSQLKADAEAGGLMGVVSGLKVGSNTVVARFEGQERDQLELTNYPQTGPMISGPHEFPTFEDAISRPVSGEDDGNVCLAGLLRLNKELPCLPKPELSRNPNQGRQQQHCEQELGSVSHEWAVSFRRRREYRGGRQPSTVDTNARPQLRLRRS